ARTRLRRVGAHIGRIRSRRQGIPEIAERLGLDGARANLLTSLGLSEVLTCQPAGIPRIQDALALAIESGEVEAVGRAWLNLVLGYREAGDFDAGLAAAEQGMKATRDMGAPSFEVILASPRSILLM